MWTECKLRPFKRHVNSAAITTLMGLTFTTNWMSTIVSLSPKRRTNSKMLTYPNLLLLRHLPILKPMGLRAYETTKRPTNASDSSSIG